MGVVSSFEKHFPPNKFHVQACKTNNTNLIQKCQTNVQHMSNTHVGKVSKTCPTSVQKVAEKHVQQVTNKFNGATIVLTIKYEELYNTNGPHFLNSSMVF